MACPPLSTGTSIMDTTENNKAFVRDFFDALNAGDAQRILDAYAEDGCVETMGNTLISGISYTDDIAPAVAAIYDVFPSGLRFTITGMTAEGDRVAVEAFSEGEHVSGQTYNNQYHFLFEMADGKLKRLREYMDTELVTDVLCRGQRPPFGGS
jgi:ketosteroid isomerase-like protein